MSVSQPFAGLPSHSPKPVVHDVGTQAPATQSDAAPGSEQAELHAPQCATDVPRFTSQPLAGSLSQSAKPALHPASMHAPAEHAAAALAKVHACPHALQCATD